MERDIATRVQALEAGARQRLPEKPKPPPEFGSGWHYIEPTSIASGTNTVAETVVALPDEVPEDAKEGLFVTRIQYTNPGAASTPDTLEIVSKHPDFNGSFPLGFNYADDQSGGEACYPTPLANGTLTYSATFAGTGGGDFEWSIKLIGWRN